MKKDDPRIKKAANLADLNELATKIRPGEIIIGPTEPWDGQPIKIELEVLPYDPSVKGWRVERWYERLYRRIMTSIKVGVSFLK